MEDHPGLPSTCNQNTPSEKYPNLMQIVIVLGSGILSSSVIATALKAWLDNRKTRLTIEIDGDMKTLKYEGHHLNQDAATIQIVLEKLSEESSAARPADSVTIEMTYDGQKEQYVLEAGDLEKHVSQDKSGQVAPEEQPFRFNLQRLLSPWLQREPSSDEQDNPTETM